MISDTHITTENSFPDLLKLESKKYDCCLHAGDFTDTKTYSEISRLIKTYAVCGNMDTFELRKKLPQKQIIKLENVHIALIHGRGGLQETMEYVNEQFLEEKDKIDIFIFGHTHVPLDKEIDGKIYFNPGSLTDTIFAPYRSYGILEITGTGIKRRIVKIE